MKILIVSAWQDRYQGDQRGRKFPSLSAVQLAALCPKDVEVEVWHEHIRPLEMSTVDADLVAITSTTGSSYRMYQIADQLRNNQIPVILGGPHVSLIPDEAIHHADAVAVGYAEISFPQLIDDFRKNKLKRVYTQPEGISLNGLPIPRYDLFEKEFMFRCYVQATRGCPYQCTFCTLKTIDHHFRVRPINEVVRDIQACETLNWLQRKFVWFWDDNLIGNPDYAKELFLKLRPLRKWWWTQCSIDAAQDPTLLRLAAESGCLAVFVGIETFSIENLLQLRKGHNRVEQYRKAVQAFHNFGIAVQAGIIVGLDGDSVNSLRLIPEALQELKIDLPFVNILTPFPGTPLYNQLRSESRLRGCAWESHNAATVTFIPRWMTPEQLERTYWDIHHELYSIRHTARRILSSARNISLQGFLLNTYVNSLFSIQNFIKPDQPFSS